MDNLTPYDSTSYETGVRKTMPFYDTFFSETLSLISYLKPDVNVWLDTGCGTGEMVHRAHAKFPSTKFLLADPSSGMLDVAIARLKSLSTDRLEIYANVGSEALPIINTSKPQVITAIMAHHYLDYDTRCTATEQCYRLLDEDGVYVTFENISPFTDAGRTIGLGRWQVFQQSQGKTEEEAAQHIGRYGTAYFPIKIEAHLNILKQVGFKVVELFWFSNMQAGFYAIK